MNILDRDLKNLPTSNFITIHSVEAEMFHANGSTGKQTDIMNLTVTFHNFVNMP